MSDWQEQFNRPAAHESTRRSSQQQRISSQDALDAKVAQFRKLCLGFNVTFLRDAIEEGATVADLKKIAKEARKHGIAPASLYDFDRKPFGTVDNEGKPMWKATQRHTGHVPCNDEERKNIIGVEFEDDSGVYTSRSTQRFKVKNVKHDEQEAVGSGSQKGAKKKHGGGALTLAGLLGKPGEPTENRCGPDNGGPDSATSGPAGNGGNCGSSD